MIVGDAIREAAAQLAATSDTARLDAELLIAHALGVTRSDLLLRHMADPAPAAFAALVERRLAHEPVAYITGQQEFYGLELEVTPAVLIPRGDSEALIEAARKWFGQAGRSPARIIDLGTGSGALLLAALTVWPDAEGVGLDRSLQALLVAMRNAQRHTKTHAGVVGEGDPVSPAGKPGNGFARLIERDWHQPGWSDALGQFDLILANPPYVEADAQLDPSVADHEPAEALFAGPDGLDDYRVLIPQLPALLTPQGVALVEIGATQAESVTAIAAAAGFTVTLHRDLADRPRVLQLQIPLGNPAPGG